MSNIFVSNVIPLGRKYPLTQNLNFVYIHTDTGEHYICSNVTSLALKICFAKPTPPTGPKLKFRPHIHIGIAEY